MNDTVPPIRAVLPHRHGRNSRIVQGCTVVMLAAPSLRAENVAAVVVGRATEVKRWGLPNF
jgi:hypothetical protein